MSKVFDSVHHVRPRIGGSRPVLHLSRESHLFAPEGAPGEQGGSLAGVAESSERGQGSPSTAVMVRWVCNSRDPVLCARVLLLHNVFRKI